MRPVDYLTVATAVADSCWLTKAYSHSIAAAEAYIVCDDSVVKNEKDITLDQQRLRGEGASSSSSSATPVLTG